MSPVHCEGGEGKYRSEGSSSGCTKKKRSSSRRRRQRGKNYEQEKKGVDRCGARTSFSSFLLLPHPPLLLPPPTPSFLLLVPPPSFSSSSSLSSSSSPLLEESGMRNRVAVVFAQQRVAVVEWKGKKRPLSCLFNHDGEQTERPLCRVCLATLERENRVRALSWLLNNDGADLEGQLRPPPRTTCNPPALMHLVDGNAVCPQLKRLHKSSSTNIDSLHVRWQCCVMRKQKRERPQKKRKK
jgi:hypothetical protein